MMKRIFLAVAFALSFLTAYGCSPAVQAAEWPVDAMNRTIEQTNFIVDGKCSGTLVDAKQKLILTNYHCVDSRIETVERESVGADGFIKTQKQFRYSGVPVSQNGYDGYALVRTTRYISEIVAHDKTRDLAVVKISGEFDQRHASPLMADGKSVTRGERIYVVGNPSMLDASVVEGIVSNVNRTFEFSWTGGEKTPMIQFSGGLYGGNSGGALYNARGELIGVPSAGFTQATFIGLAIPVTTVKQFLKDNCMASVFDSSADDAACRAAKK